MKIGFIGTGHISKSVINGILGSKLKINKIIVSKRNSKISSELKRKSKKIKISTDNQDIICLLYTSPSPRDRQKSRMPSSA